MSTNTSHRTEYRVTGMSCGHCETAIVTEVGQLPGVDRVEADAPSGSLVIISTNPVDDAAVRDSVEEAGYTAVRA